MHEGPGTSDGSTSSATSKVPAVVAVTLVVVALVIGRWLTTPFDDWVPLNAPAVLPAGVAADDLPDAAHFTCSQLIGTASDPVASAQAREALTTQSLSRAPCDGFRVQRQVLGVADLALIGLLFVGTLAIWARQRRPSATLVVTAP